MEQIVEGADLLGLHLIRVVPDVFSLISLRRINVALGVVDPDMAAPPVFGVFDFWKNQRRLEGLQETIGQEPADHRFTASHVEVETADAGHYLLLYFSNDGGRSAGDQVGLDAEAVLDISLDVLSQLSAGGNGHDNLPFLLGGFNDSVPFVLRRLPGLRLRNVVIQHPAADANDKKQHFHASPRRGLHSPKSFRATTAPGSLTL